jgi:hypothetical protein
MNETAPGNDLVRQRDGGSEIAEFNPKRFHVRDAAADYTIEHAKRIKDWPALEQAVDLKIKEQQKFSAWRETNIRDASRPTKNSDGTVRLSSAKITEITGVGEKQASRMRSKLADLESYRAYLLGSQYIAAFLEPAQNVRGTTGTGENEWFTPAEYVERVRKVLGEIDLDPASHDIAQRTVQAKRYFTKAEDGLKQEWDDRVFLNPPYAQPLIEQFIDKLLIEIDAGRITSAIVLTHNYTDTSWFQKLAARAAAICFTRGRIRFYKPDGELRASARPPRPRRRPSRPANKLPTNLLPLADAGAVRSSRRRSRRSPRRRRALRRIGGTDHAAWQNFHREGCIIVAEFGFGQRKRGGPDFGDLAQMVKAQQRTGRAARKRCRSFGTADFRRLETMGPGVNVVQKIARTHAEQDCIVVDRATFRDLLRLVTNVIEGRRFDNHDPELLQLTLRLCLIIADLIHEEADARRA